MTTKQQQAITLYIGKDIMSFPQLSRDRVIASYDAQLADFAEKVCKQMDAIPFDTTNQNLDQVMHDVMRILKQTYPDLGADAETALIWYMSYNWR